MAEPTVPNGTREKSRRGRMILFGACLLTLTVVASVSLSVLSIRGKEAQLVSTLAKQQELVANSRTEVVSTWLAGLAEQGDRLINADMFRLFASEVHELGTDLTSLLSHTPHSAQDTGMLAQQLPMMRSLLAEFASYAGFSSGRIINSHGQTYIATDASTASLSPLQAEYVRSVLHRPVPHYSPARATPGGLLMDIFLPIYPPQFEEGKGTPVAVLMLSRMVSGKISELVASTPLAGKGHRTRLVQRTADSLEEVAPWLPEGLRKLSLPVPPAEESTIPFAARTALDGEGMAYSSAFKVPGTDWWILQESDYAQARADLEEHSRTIIIIAVLITLALALLIGGLWWFLIGMENKQEAQEFKTLANTISEQKRLLDSINNTIADFIALKGSDGVYRYVNPAFAAAVGRPVEEMIGLDDAAVFGFETARRLKKSDELVYFSGQPVTVEETIFLQSRKYHVQVSKAPFCDAAECEGIVSVFRDVTDAVEAQERNRRVVRQTVEALVTTIEHSDPYLGGHTRMLCALSAEMARAMNLSDAERATVEAAANLSQVGKMFVPQEILNKPGVLSEEEKAQMERHVEHARDVLKNIDFDLPVVDAIYQMNERLDGSGYPKGLRNGEIMIAAQVLGLANTFCALVRPRAYRPAKPVDVALEIMAGLSAHYDPSVVKTLKTVLASPAGERIIADIPAA